MFRPPKPIILRDVPAPDSQRPADDTYTTTLESDWCSHVAAARQQLRRSLRVSYPCKGLQKATSAIVTMLTEGVDESNSNRVVFSMNDYMRGVLALGASLQGNVDNSTHLLFLVREGITLPLDVRAQRNAVGWIIGTAPALDVANKYRPSFWRYHSTYTKLAPIRMSEYSCVLLMDADTLVTGSLRDILDCKMFTQPKHRLVSAQ